MSKKRQNSKGKGIFIEDNVAKKNKESKVSLTEVIDTTIGQEIKNNS